MKPGVKSVLSGYLTIQISGNRVERFFQLCVNYDIVLWNITICEKDVYRCCIRLCDFTKIRPLCRKTKTRVRIEHRYGLPKYYKRYYKRIVFLLASCAMLFGIYWCSTFIWNIEIIGNSFISDENICRFLSKSDIGCGVKKTHIDTDKLELALRKNYAQIIWSSAYMDGTTLVIYVKEQIKNEQNNSLDSDSCTDIVAAKNATVASIITREGTPLVKAGDEVLRGDLLVSGVSDILDDNGEILCSIYDQADADIMGYVDYYFSKSIPMTSILSIYRDEITTNYFLRFGNHYFTLPNKKVPYEDYCIIRDYKQLKITDYFYLPVYFGKTQYVKRTPGVYNIALSRAKEIAKEEFMVFIKNLEENGVSIIDKNVMIKEMGNCYEVTGHVYALESIVTERDHLENEFE